MSDFAHERDRLHALVDKWIADREDDEIADARVDQAGLICAISGRDDDDDLVENVVSLFDTSRLHIQLGLVRVVTVHCEGRALGLDDD
jgi:hypothetical protein